MIGSTGSELSRHLNGDGSLSLRQMALEAASAIGNPPILFWGLGIGLFCLLVAVSVMPLFGRPTSSWQWVLSRRLYAVMVSLVVMTLRWPIFARSLLNTDESHSIACAMKLAVDPVFWRGIDGTTGGPLLYYPLLLPRLIGLPVEYGSARAVGLVALIGAILLLYGVVRRLFDEGVARVSVLPLIACWGLTTSNHFAHYSSEQIPVFLITLALYFLVRWWRDETGPDWALLLCGLTLGSLPFAKLQAVPIGLFLAFFGVGLILWRDRPTNSKTWRRLFGFVASGFAVPMFFLVVIVSTGVFRDFWQSYLVNNLGYAERYQQLGSAMLALPQRIWVVVDRMFWTYDLSEMVGPTLLVSLLILLGALVSAREVLVEYWQVLLLSTGFVLISILAVAFANTLFTHYFLFLAGPVALFGGFWFGVAIEGLRRRVSGMQLSVALAALVVVFLSLTVVRTFEHRMSHEHAVFSKIASIPAVDGDPVAEMALALSREGESMAVWGWQPWRYVQTGLYPATRDTQTQWQILDTPQQPYYLERFRKDLLESLPPVFIDTTGYVDDGSSPWRPVFWNREIHAHDAFPEIAEVVAEYYEQIGEIGAARIYVTKERLAEVGMQPVR